MKTENFPRLILTLILIGMATLACNLPVAFLKFKNYAEDPDKQIDLAHTAVFEYEATLTSPEGEVVGLLPLNGTKWNCQDIDGEIRALQMVSETMILKKAELDLSLDYDGEDDRLSISYSTEFERDEATIDVDGTSVAGWNHAKWGGLGGAGMIPRRDDGVFSGVFEETTTFENTYPVSSTHQLKHTHYFFGLIPPLDYEMLYLCDQVANPVPDPLGSLTAENFQDHCAYWYYECTIQ